MSGSPRRGGGITTIGSVIVTALVVATMVFIVTSGGGLHRPLTANATAVAAVSNHPRQG